MKKLIAIAAITLFNLNAFTQNMELNGSGKVITKSVDLKDFDKLELKDLNGKIEVQVGKPFSITVSIDDNLMDLLEIKNENGLLRMNFKSNKNNRRYIEKTNIKIQINMPVLTEINHNGNSDLLVTGINGGDLKLSNLDNGNSKLKGNINFLEIAKKGNGNINAYELITKIAEINTKGNGELFINVNERLEVIASGNGNVTNKGKAGFGGNSSASGNASLIKK
jgi:Putative auto-transporter adhesin, head GIN domain